MTTPERIPTMEECFDRANSRFLDWWFTLTPTEQRRWNEIDAAHDQKQAS